MSTLLAGLLSLVGCAPVRPDLPRPAGEIRVAALEGRWTVLESSFPMWLDGKKTDPAFEYKALDGGEGKTLLDDRVTYLEKGKPGSIEGIDTPDPEDPTHLVWRGKGILKLFTSHWYLVLGGASEGWAVIYFSSTIATPEGVDIIARGASLPVETLERIHAAIAAHPVLREKAKGLRPVFVTR